MESETVKLSNILPFAYLLSREKRSESIFSENDMDEWRDVLEQSVPLDEYADLLRLGNPLWRPGMTKSQQMMSFSNPQSAQFVSCVSSERHGWRQHNHLAYICPQITHIFPFLAHADRS